MRDDAGSSADGLLASTWSVVRLGQFASVGATGAAVDTAVLFVVVEFGGLGPLAGKVLAWIVAVAFIFAVNEHWTFARFGSDGPRAVGGRFLRSVAVRIGGFLVTLAVYSALLDLDVWYLLANLVGIGIGFLVNYACESLFTWRVHREEA